MTARQGPQLIMGLGESGFAACDLLRSQGYPIFVADTRSQPPYLDQLQQKYQPLRCFDPQITPELMLEAERIIVSPGIDPNDPMFDIVRRYHIPLISEIELFSQFVDAPVIAITGSNGKSTATMLLAAMLKAHGLNVKVGGNLSPSATRLLGDPQTNVYVLELSSYQLQTTYTLNPYSAVVLNISPDHLERHGTFKAYADTKKRVYRHCRYPVVNRDMTEYSSAADVTGFTLQKPEAYDFGIRYDQEQAYFCHGHQKLFPVTYTPLSGRHNWANILAAMALASTLDCSYEAMAQAVRNYHGLKHRCQCITEAHGVAWYNDSKSTNIGAAAASIQGLGVNVSGHIILIMGGQSKESGFDRLQPLLQRYVKSILLFGEDAPLIDQKLGDNIASYRFNDLQSCVQNAYNLSTPGDAVLLSPACASFDMFANFKDRGEQFELFVHKLIQGAIRA